MSDLYLPVACTSCQRMALLQVVANQVAPCPRCGSPVAVAPGQVYRIEDVPLFKRLESLVFANALSREDGGRIVDALSDGVKRIRNPEYCLLQVVDTLPTVQFLLDSVPVDRPYLARAAGMILTIVTAQTHQLRPAAGKS